MVPHSRFARPCPAHECFRRKAEWPPEIHDADMIVNATSERDEVLVELREGRRSSIFRIRRRRPRSQRDEWAPSVIGGLEVLVAQGAASFELWTGVSAPVEVMRRAVGLSA